MSVWTIIGASGAEREFYAAGFSRLQRKKTQQAQSIVTFRDGSSPFDGEVAYPERSTVLIKKDGRPWFNGRVTKVPKGGSGIYEQMSYELADPWWYLDNCIYQQQWMINPFTGDLSELVPTWKSRVIFGQQLTPDGYEKISIDEQIRDILNYAIGLGAPFQVGNIVPDMTIPYAETKDVSCAEALKMQLRFAPDAVQFFDHSTRDETGAVVPTLHIWQRGQCTFVNFSVSQKAAGSTIDIVERTDLWVPSVCLKYDQTDEVDGSTWTTTTVDVAPVTATGQEFGALVATMELSGFSVTNQKQRVTTEGISANDIAWWRKKHKWLDSPNVIPATDENGDPLPWVNPGSGTVVPKPGLVPKGIVQPAEVVQGAVPKWLSTQSNPCIVSATLNYQLYDEDQGYYRQYRNVPFSSNVIGTDLTTGEYSHLTAFTDAEPMPVGLAQRLLTILQVEQFDGTFTVQEDECSGALDLGRLLNLTDGFRDWAAMGAQIQQVAEDIDSGTTAATFGPAKHLGFDDFVALLRVNRGRVTSYRLDERASGKSSAAANVDGAADSAQPNSSNGAAIHTDTRNDENNASTVSVKPKSFRLFDDQGNVYGEISVDPVTGESSAWFFNEAGAKTNIKLSCKDKQITIYDESTGNTAYLTPGSAVVTTSNDTVWGSMAVDPDKGLTIEGYDQDGAQNNLLYESKSGQLKLWNESTGDTTTVEPASILVSNNQGGYGMLIPGILDLMSINGNEIYIDADDLNPGTYASMKRIDVCNNGQPAGESFLAGDPVNS